MKISNESPIYKFKKYKQIDAEKTARKLLRYVKDNPVDELKQFSGKFLSISVIAFYPERIISCLEALEKSCFDHRNFEINIAIPIDDNESPDLEPALLKYKKNSKLNIIIIKTPYDYWTSMHSHNQMIFESSDSSTYFHMDISDRYRFSVKNWDLILKEYIKAVPDHLFFLRNTGIVRNFKARISAHDAWFRPDNWSIFTRKYLEAIGGFLPNHHGHDGSCEMIAYFISKNKKDPFDRGFPMMKFFDTNQVVASNNHSQKNFYLRYYKQVYYYHKNYFSLNGLNLCSKAAVRVFLYQYAFWHNIKKPILHEDKNKIYLLDKKNNIKKSIKYRLSYISFIREKLHSLYGKAHGFNFSYRFYHLLKKEYIYDFLTKNFIKKNKIYKFRKLARVFFRIVTKLFFTEKASKQLLDKLMDSKYKEVITGKELRDFHKNLKSNKAIEDIAKEQERKYKKIK